MVNSTGQKVCDLPARWQVQELAQENAMLRGKMASMRDYLGNAELETKASRETIMRLVCEAEREQKMNSKYNIEFDGMRAVGKL